MYMLNSGDPILGLAACDEVNKGTSNVGGKSEMGAMMEVLTNMAVAGAAYLTSSGTAGATDEKGVSKRNHGGTVELRLGSLIIGKIKALPIVTPIELTADRSIGPQNTLILLQPLDADGKAKNGISSRQCRDAYSKDCSRGML
ncbi:MAG: hypothetical protein ABI727_06600 [Nitrosospira sp.]